MIIGNGKQEKQIDRLLRQAGKDKLVKWVLDGKPGEKYTFELNLCPDFQSGSLQAGIVEEIGLEEYKEPVLNSMLVHYSTGEPHYKDDNAIYSVADASALLAVQYLALEEAGMDLASRLLSGIELHVDFDKKTGLVKYGNTNPLVYASSNAALALAYIALGKKDFAKSLVKNIEKHIGFDKETGLAYTMVESKSVTTNNSALLSYVYTLLGREDDALRLVEGIEKYMGFDKGLARHCPEKQHAALYTHDNAALALAYFALGRGEEAEMLIRFIEDTICFESFKGARLVKESTKSSLLLAYPNTLLALAFMAKEHHEKEVKK